MNSLNGLRLRANNSHSTQKRIKLGASAPFFRVRTRLYVLLCVHAEQSLSYHMLWQFTTIYSKI